MSRCVAARPFRRRQRGAALLLAMLILTLVVSLSAGMVWQQTRAVQVEAAERARAQSAWILNGALDWARLLLSEDQRAGRERGQEYDALDEPWATPLAEARLSTFLAADRDNTVDSGPEAFLSGAIVDAQSRWNLRNLIGDDGQVVEPERAALARLVRLAGLPDELTGRIVEALRSAWAPQGRGVDGTVAGDPMLAPTRLQDLAWAGIEPALLARLAPWVDLLPLRTPVNANTASREALVAAIDNLDLGSAERLVLARQRSPFRTLDEVRAQLGEAVLDPTRVSVVSRHFLVQGRLRLEDRVLEESSLVQRRPDNRGARVVVLRRQRQSLNLESP
jgi:general secretion pathway protein K